MDLNIVWAKGKCDGDAYFVSDEEIFYRTGSFINIYAIDKNTEISLQQSIESIECICADSKLKLICAAKADVCILSYPSLKILSYWLVEKSTNFMQISFAGDDYLVTLEGAPNFNLTLWNWKKASKLKNFQHEYPIEDASFCLMSYYPHNSNFFVFQQLDTLHFYEIEDFCAEANLIKKTIYLPVVNDEEGESFLTDKKIETLTYFDKMKHGSWGIHSDMLHRLPLKVFCSELTERELVKFYDFLLKQKRLQASAHCWLPDKRLLIACFCGTILLMGRELDIEIIKLPTESKDVSDNYVTCMALNKSGLFMAEKNGDVLHVPDIEKWKATNLISIEEFPMRMKFSPDFGKLLIVNRNGSLILLDVTRGINDVLHISTNNKDSRIVGIFVANETHCVTARADGLVEAWQLCSGVPVSQFHLHENLQEMEGCPSSSTIIISNCKSYVFIVDISVMDELRIVHTERPCEETIKNIKCDNFGRFAFLVSNDKLVFIKSILPSRNFEMFGFLALQFDVEDMAVFSKSLDNVTFVSFLRKGKNADYAISIEIPKDFDVNPIIYQKDESGVLNMDFFKFTEINLGSKCSSVLGHLLNGFLFHLSPSEKILKIPYDDLRTFKHDKDESVDEINRQSSIKMFLSPAHYILLTVSESGEVCVRKAHNYEIISRHTFARYSHSISPCSIFKNLIFIEGCKGVLVCAKIPNAQDMGEMSWATYCKKKTKEENRVLSELKKQSKMELDPWITRQLICLNQDNINELENNRNKLELKLKDIENELQDLAKDNFSLPNEHQIDSEEFILDDNAKEQLINSRKETVRNYEETLKEKIKLLEKNTSNMREECIDNMLEKGKILEALHRGSRLYNYSVPIMSDDEKEQIRYSFKKIQFQKYWKKRKAKEKIDKTDFERKLSFDINEGEKIEAIDADVIKQPFQLQSREDRTDYVHMIKYIIFKKRLAFNRRFNEVEALRKKTVEKIKENNKRIREIMSLTKEEKTIWEPSSISNDPKMFEVTEDEIENSKSMHLENESATPKGIADYFLKDEWLLKLKVTRRETFQATLKKENLDLLKKEMEKIFKTINSLVEHYDKIHGNAVRKKLASDLEINREELQLYLILFSSANWRSFKVWEMYEKKVIMTMEDKLRMNSKFIGELKTTVDASEKEVEGLEKECTSLDGEIKPISRMSRNKQAFLEAYNKRPLISVDENSLNPYEEVKIYPKNLFEDLNAIKNKPPKVPLALWKQLCSLREQKISYENQIGEKRKTMKKIKGYLEHLNDLKKSIKMNILLRKENLQRIHETRIRCGFETPTVLPVADLQLELKYPDNLNFADALFLRRFHVEGLNGMITNAGSRKLEAVQKLSKIEFQIAKNESKVRIDLLKLRDKKKEIELVKSIPLTKDIQKIIQDPKGFSIQDKIDALEKSKQMEMKETAKQMDQVSKRISNIEQKKEILKRSTHEKKKEIEKLTGDIAELRKIEQLKNK